MELIALDIGGTHARFAHASVDPAGKIELDEPITLKTSDHGSLQLAWEEFERRTSKPVPPCAAIAIAGPVTGEVVRMTNNSWTINTGALDEQLEIDHVTVLNDFAAVAHACAQAPDELFVHLTGPDIPLPQIGNISVVGPGTGLGVAQFHRWDEGGVHGYHVLATEGGHVDFSPTDSVEDAFLQRLRQRHRRVSLERVVSGPGIIEIYATLAHLERRPVADYTDRQIWERGLSGEDTLAKAAIERFCMALGSCAGDFALAHGAAGVVIAGGLGYRLLELLPKSGFADRFRFKGRYEQLMASLPVKLITHPQPGLYGAVAAFAREHREQLT